MATSSCTFGQLFLTARNHVNMFLCWRFATAMQPCKHVFVKAFCNCNAKTLLAQSPRFHEAIRMHYVTRHYKSSCSPAQKKKHISPHLNTTTFINPVPLSLLTSFNPVPPRHQSPQSPLPWLASLLCSLDCCCCALYRLLICNVPRSV